MPKKSPKSLRKAPYGIGIDIGGTKVSLVLGNSKGKILEKEVFKTPSGKDIPKLFVLMKQTLEDWSLKRGISRFRVRGVGVGIPGLFNQTKGVIEQSPNLKDWVGMNLRRKLEKLSRVPVTIENDANATAVAEKYFGHGRDVKTFIYITISTGIGSGVIVDGQLQRGASWSAGEVGHMVVDPYGWKNRYGIPGTLEGEASGTAIGRKATALFKKPMSSADVKDLAVKGNKKALRLLRETADHLAIGLSNIIMFLNPELIVLGGGVMKGKGGQLLLKEIQKALPKYAWPKPLSACPILRTRLLENNADLGALSLVFES